MNLCPKCTATVIPGAKFCHRCGDNIVERTKTCPACKGENPLSSVYCHDCGFHFDGGQSGGYQPRYAIDYKQESLTEQVQAIFFASLRARVEQEHDIARYSEFVERFYHSKFKEIYVVRSGQIAREVATHYNRFGDNGLPEIDQKLERSFDGLLDYFIIQFCPDLHHFVLPTTILKHEQAQPGKTNLRSLIADYLDLDQEQEMVHTNFVLMPENHLVNACKGFLFAQRKEKVFFILDLSIKGNCKEGFAMTDRGLYWKLPFERAQSVQYSEIGDVKKEKDWLLINGNFFTANARLNLKVCKLLKKLRGWKEPEVAVG
jgi:hypothetical protein